MIEDIKFNFLLSSRVNYYLRLLTICLLFATSGKAVLAQGLYFPSDDADWETVNPDTVGWDADKISDALDIAGERNSSGVVILHNGRIMAERYWELDSPPRRYRNYVQGRDSAGHVIEDVASAQKSVVATLTGIAQEKGLLSIDQSVSEYLGSGWTKASTEQEQVITIQHLLSMNSGLATDMTFAEDAGSVWLYNTPAYHYLMRIIEQVSGQDRNTITSDWITSKLGMENSSWTPRPWAAAAIGVGFSTTARDLARFGLMIQAGGKWGDQQVINDADFLTEMLSPSQSLNPAYGYLWWINGQAFSLASAANARRLTRALIPSAPDDLVAMQGAMDRKLYLVPSLNLVITRLGANGRANNQSFNEAFWSALMEAKL
jgi:CubicO group peptidase (beta-lactamase class C family)